MQGFALNNISDCYVGSNQASEIWLGQTKIWPTTPPHDYSRDYLTFEALEPTSFSFTQNDLQYSLDNGSTWTTLTAGNSTPQLTIGDKILWKQTGLTPTSNFGIGTFSSTGNFEVSGNIMSLYYGNDFIGQISLSEKNSAFKYLFQNCSKLVNAENLILSATTLANSCYGYMFDSCTSLVTVPELPATTLADYCYDGMFYHCTSLTTAPELPATILSYDCYGYMFYLCTSLTTAPKLPATTLADYCYSNMFRYCTSLTTTPELPATTLAIGCYSYMFQGCTSLTTTPVLPATILYYYCYGYMFAGCTSLTTAPELPATTLADSCYYYMFFDCTSLTTAPELPATTLADSCYARMFEYCHLTTAPELPATTLATGCYQYMFFGCTSLNYIKCLATNISASNCTDNWVNNVSSTGTFVKDTNTTWPTGVSGIPSGWAIQNA